MSQVPLEELDVRERFLKNRREIFKSLSFEALMPLLCEGGALFSIKEGQSLIKHSEKTKRKKLVKKLEKKPGLYSSFFDCVRRERTHLGHTYIRTLLEGEKYASESEQAYSMALRDAVTKRLTDFTGGINLSELVPHLYQSSLLTEHEQKYLSSAQHSTNDQIMFLISALDTKGPRAYILFEECLRTEHSHLAHNELSAMMSMEAKGVLGQSRKRQCRAMFEDEAPLCKIVPQRLKMHGPLKNKQYRELVVTFKNYHHNGEWAKLEAEALNYLEKKDTHSELKVAVILELAVSLISQQKEERVIELVGEAREKCTKLSGDNPTFLQGRCEYVLSRLYRYLKQYDKAKEHAEKAMIILSPVEHGEDSAFANYCFACIMAESETSKVGEIENYLMCAISDAQNQDFGFDLMAPHAYMRLALKCLGSTQIKGGKTTEETSIRKAENCLKMIDPASLSVRARCNFHLIKSDLYHSKDQSLESKAAAQCALDIATECKFPCEVESAQSRLENLQLC